MTLTVVSDDGIQNVSKLPHAETLPTVYDIRLITTIPFWQIFYLQFHCSAINRVGTVRWLPVGWALHLKTIRSSIQMLCFTANIDRDVM